MGAKKASGKLIALFLLAALALASATTAFAASMGLGIEPNYFYANATTSKEPILRNWFEVTNYGSEPAVVENVLHPEWVDVTLSSRIITDSVRVDYAIDLVKAGKGVFDVNIEIISSQGNAVYPMHLSIDQPAEQSNLPLIPEQRMTERGLVRKKSIFMTEGSKEAIVFDWDALPSFILLNPFQAITSMVYNFVFSLQPQNLKVYSTYRDQTLYSIDTNSLSSNKPWWSFLFGG